MQFDEWGDDIVVLLDAGNPKYVEALVPKLYRRDVLAMKVGDNAGFRCFVRSGDSIFFTVFYLSGCSPPIEGV